MDLRVLDIPLDNVNFIINIGLVIIKELIQ